LSYFRVVPSLLALAALALAGLAPAPAAAERPVLEIGGATFRPYPLAVAPPLAAGDAVAPAGEIEDALALDLEVSGLFEVIPRKSFLADAREPADPARIAWDRWTDVGAEGLVKIEVTGGDQGIRAVFRLFDVATHRKELELALDGRRADARRLGHRFADELVRHFTREPGAFSTRIAFVRRSKGAKEIWTADYDGRNAVPVTERGGIAMLPAWSPAGDKLAFTFYKRTRNYPNGHPQVWSVDVATSAARALATRGDLNTGAAYSPDGTKIAFTLSDEGNSEIWVMNADGSGLKRLTDSPGIDTSPTWSPDGRRIAFVSDRHGSPQIFVMNADGSGVERLTRQGNYNQTPVWSPRGDLIAFTARDERIVFDIFTIDVNTKEVTRITQDQGHNEHPTWAPNGRLLMFSSTRDGTPALYVSSPDGSVQKRVSPNDKAEYTGPAWGPLRK
jgi:TolB protein